MKKTMEYVRKAFGLVLNGYSGWMAYRAARYFRSYFLPMCRANSVSPEWLSQIQIQAAMEDFNRAFQKTQTHALCVHLYYSDVLQELLKQPLVQEERLDFYISLGACVDKEFFKKLEPYKGRVKLYQFPNRGRDVYPFLKIYPELLGYEWVCKIHSKRSPQIRDGELWRQDLIGSLLGQKSFDSLQTSNSSIQIIAPNYSLLPVSLFIGGNGPRMKELLKKMSLDFPQRDFLFIAGTMFWFRPQALQKLLQLGDADSLFEEESPTIDGLTAHAFERLFYFIANLHPKTHPLEDA